MKIINETAKALLIANDTHVAWIKKSWRRADGSFTPAAIRSLEESTETIEDYNQKIEDRNATDVAIDRYEIAKETEKAIALRASTSFFNHLTEEFEDREGLVWIPKSMIKEGRVAKWFLQNKVSELTETYKGAMRIYSLNHK